MRYFKKLEHRVNSKNMKKYIFIALFIVQTINLMAQTSRFKDGETINVWATSGLNMRDKPDAQSAKIAAIPYGAKVVVQPNIGVKIPFEVEEFKGFTVKGYWLLVKYGNTEGFVFDVFLSRLPAPIPTEQDLAIETYLHQQVGEVGQKYDVGVWDNHLGRVRALKIGETHSDSYKQKYNSNISYVHSVGNGSHYTKVIFADISLYEGYILLKTYTYDPKIDTLSIDKNLKLTIKGEGCDYHVKQEGSEVIISGGCGC
jgi:hypothetical protein